jgi:hypothetical protein
LGYGGLTADRLYTFPDKSGTFAMLSDLAGTNWSTLGNAGLGAANFIGTTDAIDLKFKTNGIIRFTINASGGLTSKENLSILSGSNDTSVTLLQTSGIGNSGAAQLGQNSLSAGGYLKLTNNVDVNNNVTVRANNITGQRVVQLPDASGTLALVNIAAFTGVRVINTETYTWVNGILISVTV